MTAEELIAEFKAAFGPEWREAIVDALQRAYRKACGDYDEEEGSNSATFGYCVYNYALKRLCDAAPVNGATVRSKAPFRLLASAFEVGCYKVGHTEYEDINKSFPDNNHAAWHLSNPQLSLPFIIVPEARRGGVVVAHFGNPTDGLCAVFLALPDSVDEKNRINHWGHTEQIWRRGERAVQRPPIKVTLPPEEAVQSPVIRRKRKSGDQA